jgi:hypothetical protein
MLQPSQGYEELHRLHRYFLSTIFKCSESSHNVEYGTVPHVMYGVHSFLQETTRNNGVVGGTAADYHALCVGTIAMSSLLCDSCYMTHSSFLCKFPQLFIQTCAWSVTNMCHTGLYNNSEPVNTFQYNHIPACQNSFTYFAVDGHPHQRL